MKFKTGLNLTYESMCPYQKMLIKTSQLMIPCTISDSTIFENEDRIAVKWSMTEENKK